MNVYTYYNDIGWPEPTKLLALWKTSWAKRGWTPVVLNQKDAEKSKYFWEVARESVKYPSINNCGYEFANYVRHCAMEALGGGLIVDYDVINYSFTSEDMTRIVAGRDFMVFGNGGFVYSTLVGAQSFCQSMLDWTKGTKLCVMLDGRPHLSDMYMLHLLHVPHHLEVSPCYQDRGWEIAPTVHYNNNSVHTNHDRSVDKSEIVAFLREV